MEKKRSVTILFLGNIERPQDYSKSDKLSDQIDFGRPAKITLIRIPRLKRELYGKLTSVTQAEPIKNFQIYFRNLEETNGKYSLLASNNELMTTSTNDILITPHKAFITDLIVIRGFFSKLSLCIYGQLVDQKNAKLWKVNAGVSENNIVMEIKRNIFEEKRWCIHKIEDDIKKSGEECLNLSIAQNQQEAANDDDINEPQIKNICNISQHLLNTFQQINEDQYIVKFRQNIETINNLLQKLFKSKQLGLYYPKQQNYSIQNEIPLPLVHICLESLKLHLSDQYRVLETLKMLAQIPRHANLIIESGGVAQISQLFLHLYSSNVIYFSTFKNLVLEVCIALSHWPNAAQRMVTKLQQNVLQQIYMPVIIKQKQVQEKKEKIKQKSRSRGKQKNRSKKSKSPENSESQKQGKHKKQKKDKKDKKDKKKRQKSKQKEKEKEKNKKKDKSRQRQKSRERSRSKSRQQKKDRKQKKEKKNKQKQKPKQKQNQKQKLSVKKQEQQSYQNVQSSQSQRIVNKQSFYQILFFILLKQKNYKTLNLIKVLLEQIVQTLTKGKDISEEVALTTSYLRDTKYMFNPGSQIINSKSLKIFATFQPFLNQFQSQNVDCKYISEKQKLKYPYKYNINPKIVKILNQINLSIIKNSHKEALGLGTPFDENFMVMMSELIFEKEKPITSQFVRIVNSFKAIGLMNLKRNEAAISIITQYIYKALLDDEGINTLLYIDQIHASLIKFVSFLNEDPTIFSTELKSRIRLLSNYATPYDHFTRAEAVFKSFCQYFLKLFKYENYELQINNKAKLTDFRKKQYQKLLNPFLYENLMENFALKNFNDVSTSQPLLQIDVTLKIFLVLCDYNKNIWTTFYQNKLINGFASLLNKVSSLLIFYLSHSANRWTAYTYMKSYLLTIDNYMNLVKHLLMLFAKKCKYECAFNDLLQQDIFEEVQLYEKIIEIYIAVYNAYHDTSLMIYINKSQNKIKVIMSLVIQILDQFVTSFQLINHHTRELKLIKFLQNIYIKHYSSLSSRPALINIYATIIKFSQGSSAKFLSSYLLDNHFTLNKFIAKDIAYVPNNDKSMLENIIRSNVYRANGLICANLSILIKNLYLKSQYTDKICDILDKIFDQIEGEHKESEQEMGKISWKCINKFYLYSQILIRSGITIKNKLDDKILRFFKKTIQMFKKRIDYKQSTQSEERDIFIIFLKAKINYMGYFNKLFKENTQNPTLFIQFYQLTAKALSLQYFTFDKYQTFNQEYIEAINLYALKICSMYINGLTEISSLASYQCLLLYGQMMENPYKPQTFINFYDLLNSLEKIVQDQLYIKTKQEMKQIQSIISGIFYFLAALTTIDQQFLFTTQSRRGAIIYLLGSNQKQFPFKYLRNLSIYKMIPAQFQNLLLQYFSYPIVQKSIILKPKYEVKPSIKSKNTIYSKSLFNIISQHDPVSKARFKYIGGQWIGGDLNKTLFSPFKVRNYQEEIQKILTKNHGFIKFQSFHYRQYQSIRQEIEFNDLFYLFLKKDKFQTVKKEVQKTIQLKDVVPRNAPQQIKKEPAKVSTSPNKIDYQPNFSRISPTHIAPNSNGNGTPGKNSSSSQQRNYTKNNYNRPNNSNINNQPNYNPGNNYPRQPSHTNSISNPNNVGNNFSMIGNNQMPGYNNHYPPNYYHPPSNYQPQPRYSPYPPVNPGPPPMYIPGQPVIGKPPVMYNNGMIGMYPVQPTNMAYLSPIQQQLFQEAYNLVNEIRNPNIPESVKHGKKSRLNSILSSQPKVHAKLKELKDQQQL